MRPRLHIATAAILIVLVPACQPAPDRDTPPPAAPEAGKPAVLEPPVAPPKAVQSSVPQAAFSAIAADEMIRFVGTEPFWGGNVRGGELVYSTPENQAGDTIAVRRFAGNNGLGFSGSLNGGAFDMTVTPGRCSDGMSDRTYPFTVTLKLGDEQRNGCAWTDRSPFSGPENP